MRRWVVPLLLVMIVSGMLVYRGTRATTHHKSPPSVVRDPDAIKAIETAMTVMGYDGKAFTGHNWRAESCEYQNYLVSPDVENAEPFLFVRSLKTGEMQFLRASEFDQILKRHVSYDGPFLGLPRGLGDNQEQYSLGSIERNGDLVFVYVGFDEAACGLKVDEVVYWAPRVNETVKLNLQLLPKK